MSAESDHAKGLLITAIGGLILTFDIPLIRLADGDIWPIMMVRSGCTFAAVVVVWLAARALRKPLPPLIPGRAGLAVGALYTISALLFMGAVFNTTTANLVFILALNSMISALFSWVFLRERPRAVTLGAMVIMIGCVLLIIDEGVAAGNWAGDMMALGAVTSLSGAITVSRASGKNMGFAPLVSALVPMAVAMFMTAGTGYRIEAPWWIILNGVVLVPVSFFLLANGPKWITAPEVAMFYLLETVLAPVWMWMIFTEVPSNQSLLGGAILIVTLAAHSLWQLHSGRHRRAALAARHPV